MIRAKKAHEESPIVRKKRKVKIISNLRLFNRGIVSVTHRADVLTVGSLFVALPEELFHDEVHPAAVELQRLRGVRQVGTVDHVLQNLTNEEIF